MTIGVRIENMTKLYNYAYTQKNSSAVECIIKLLFATACVDGPIEEKINRLIYLYIDEYVKIYHP